MEQTTYLEKDRFKQKKGKGGDSFASNNNNPFLVSPYSPVNLGAFATNNFVNEVSTIVSTLFGNLASVLDVATYTLNINTIQPMPVTNNPNQSIIMKMSTLTMNAPFYINVNTPRVNMSQDLHVGNNLVAQNLYFSTATGSTISTFTSNTSGQLTATNMSFVKMNGDTITTSTLNVSTISSTKLFINVPSVLSISTPTVNMSQDLYVSHNLIAQNLYFSTATGSTISTFTSNTSGQLTATNMGFLTMTGDTINTSTINLSSIKGNAASIKLSAPIAFNITTQTVTMSNDLHVTNNVIAENLYFSTAAGAQLSASNIGFVSISGNDATVNYNTSTSSMNTNLISSGMILSDMISSNMISSDMITISNIIGDTVTINSTLNASTLIGTNSYLSMVSISSLSASTIRNNTASISSLSVSAITNTNASISTLSASTMTNTSASVSSLSVSSITNTSASISVLNATTINNTTLNGSNIICSSVNAATYLSSNSATVTNATVTTLGNTTLNGISINGNTIICSTVTAATTLTSNGTTSAGNLNFNTITWPSGTIGTTPTLTAGNSYVTIKIGATTYKLALYQ
jgi:hypothetical protein